MSFPEKLESLKNRYQGDTAILLACGPSLNSYSQESLKALLGNQLIIAIKQAYLTMPGLIDFHLLNRQNLVHYDYPQGEEPIVVVVYSEHKPVPDIRSDLAFPIENTDQIEHSLLETGEIEASRLEKSLIRPWGPGIMNEIGIYFPVFLGVKRIITLGWDLSSPESNVHFYDGSKCSTNIAKHDLGELRKQIFLSQLWNEWLKVNSRELRCAGNGSHVDPSILRASLTDLLR